MASERKTTSSDSHTRMNGQRDLASAVDIYFKLQSIKSSPHKDGFHGKLEMEPFIKSPPEPHETPSQKLDATTTAISLPSLVNSSPKQHTEIVRDVEDPERIVIDHSRLSVNSATTNLGCFPRYVEQIRHTIISFIEKYGKYLKIGVYCLLVLAYLVYFGYAIHYSLDKALILIVVNSIIVFCLIYKFIRDKFGHRINRVVCPPIQRVFWSKWKYTRWVVWLLILAAVVVFLVFTVGSDTRKLTSVAGIIVILFVCYLTSTNPAQVRWRPVFWGIGLQFVLGVIILRWKPGFQAFKVVADMVEHFFKFADTGSKFIFGDAYLMHPIAFQAIPTVIFFGSVVNVLMYLGVIQVLIEKIAWLMQTTMGTTSIESFNAAASIFLSLMETSMFLRYYIHLQTLSEIFAIQVSAFATVAGFVLAMYVGLGAPAEHVLSAAIMSAPAAMVVSKLNYPETEVSRSDTDDKIQVETGKERNIFEAAANGATTSVKLVCHVAATIIAFLGLITFINAALSWFGSRVGYAEITFQGIFSYIFLPLSLIMGVEPNDARQVAGLIGTKIFVDEVIAYSDLGVDKEAGTISDRSVTIATYCLCGFGSISAIGVNISLLAAINPERRDVFSGMALRALIMGNVAGFLTACVAGILHIENEVPHNSTDPLVTAATSLNSTIFS